MSNRKKLRGKDWAPLASAIAAIPPDKAAAALNDCAPGYLDQIQAAEAETSGLHAAAPRLSATASPPHPRTRLPGTSWPGCTYASSRS